MHCCCVTQDRYETITEEYLTYTEKEAQLHPHEDGRPCTDEEHAINRRVEFRVRDF